MKLFLLFASFYIPSSLLCQTSRDSILRAKNYEFNYKADKTNFDSFNLRLDSIQVTIKYNAQYIFTNNYFEKSNRLITVEFYYQNDTLKYIEAKEICPTKPKLTCLSQYFVINKEVLYDEHGSSMPTQTGVIHSVEEITRMHSCPDCIKVEFINSYVFLLYDKMKTLMKRK